jgi:hypothetical protein
MTNACRGKECRSASQSVSCIRLARLPTYFLFISPLNHTGILGISQRSGNIIPSVEADDTTTARRRDTKQHVIQ